MKIRFSSELNLEYNSLVCCTPYSGMVEVDGIKIGGVRFMRLIRQPGVDVEEALDMQANDETQIDFLFDDYGDLRVGPRTAFMGNILCLAHLHLLRPFRGLNLGRYIIQRVLRHFGSDCDVAVMDVMPLQFAGNPMFEDEFTEDTRGEAMDKLKKYYRGLGFRPVNLSWLDRSRRRVPPRLENHMYVNLQAHLSEKRRYDTIPERISGELMERVMRKKAA